MTLFFLTGFTCTFVSEPHMRWEKPIQQRLQLGRPRRKVSWRGALPNSSLHRSSTLETVRNRQDAYRGQREEKREGKREGGGGLCSFHLLTFNFYHNNIIINPFLHQNAIIMPLLAVLTGLLVFCRRPGAASQTSGIQRGGDGGALKQCRHSRQP